MIYLICGLVIGFFVGALAAGGSMRDNIKKDIELTGQLRIGDKVYKLTK